jgi:hypothetical protein
MGGFKCHNLCQKVIVFKLSGFLLTMFLKTLLVTFLLINSGCATLPLPTEVAAGIVGYTPPHQPERGKGLVYVVRPHTVATLVRFHLVLDETIQIGHTKGNEYLYFHADPGSHSLCSRSPENNHCIDIEVVDGNTHFIRQFPTPGWLLTKNELEVIKEDLGLYSLKNTSLGVLLFNGKAEKTSKDVLEKAKKCQEKGGVWVNDSCQISVD